MSMQQHLKTGVSKGGIAFDWDVEVFRFIVLANMKAVGIVVSIIRLSVGRYVQTSVSQLLFSEIQW